MKPSVLNYALITTENYASSFVDAACAESPAFSYALFAKLPSTILINPSYDVRFVQSPAKNRYLQEVIVGRIPPTKIGLELATGVVVPFTYENADAAKTSDAEIATVTVTNGTVEITTVAAGTVDISILDKANHEIAIITIKVE